MTDNTDRKIDSDASQDGELKQNLAFAYRIHRPRKAAEPAIFLLHGSGVDETILMPFAAAIAPNSTLIAARGRVPQEDGWRWFERITPTRFGQDSIRREADAFAEFIVAVAAQEKIDPDRAVFLGYSNGANLTSSIMLLRPGLIEQAALLRSMPVLDERPMVDLSDAKVLVVSGKADVTYGPYRAELVDMLRDRHARVESHMVPLGHEFGDADADLLRPWLAKLSRTAGDAAV